jgi:hypothetical protein
MKIKYLISSLLVVGVLANIISGPGCANIIPPQGGPRDTIPPVLLKSEPGDSARNFTGNKLTFIFDEFVDVQNVQENLLVSPLPKITPSIEYKLKTVTVKIKDTLEANTTYSFNFGNAIKDFTEGNPIKDFTYTFSTGLYIDSLELSGKVILAETGKTDTTLIVVLHTSANDSSVVKDKPRYVAKLDGKGNFIFKNLPPKTFYIYALKDDGGTKRYLNNKQLFAFADKPVAIQGSNDPVTLYAWASKQTDRTTSTATTTTGRNRTGTTDKRLKYQTNINANLLDLLGNLVIKFDTPLRSFDSLKLRLYTDSTFTPVTNYKTEKDSTGTSITFINSWKENTKYHIIFDKDFAEDTTGKKLLKTDTLSFTTKKLSDYGSVKIKLRNVDITKHPVLQFLSNGSIYKSYPLSSAEFSQPLFPPGEYELSILFDENNNGTWDPGEFFIKHKQPELVKPIERKINVKAGWQNDFEIAL